MLVEDNKGVSLLKVQVYAGNEAFPIEGARVVISCQEKIEAFLITDENGSTPYIKLPSPKREESLSPQMGEKSYVYRGNIYADGFMPKKDLYISLVGGTSSVLKVNLIPLYKGGN